MIEDYKNTKYCSKLEKLAEKKKAVKERILIEHSRAEDMHTYVSKDYKTDFLKAYNWKCAYCGVSIDIISIGMFEIDHFIPKSSAQFNNSKAKAGYIENLVLSCQFCNRRKGNIELPTEDHDKINPDGTGICKSFIRDDEYYIKISDEFSNNKSVQAFYNGLNLGSSLHRIDYLLMNMRGLIEKVGTSSPAFGGLSIAIDLLQKKRNTFVGKEKVTI